jgi:hypothetical protein
VLKMLNHAECFHGKFSTNDLMTQVKLQCMYGQLTVAALLPNFSTLPPIANSMKVAPFSKFIPTPSSIIHPIS